MYLIFLYVYILDPEVVKAGAKYFDSSYSTLISPKWQIPPPFYQIAGMKMKNVYTDKSFSEDLKAYIQVRFTRHL